MQRASDSSEKQRPKRSCFFFFTVQKVNFPSKAEATSPALAPPRARLPLRTACPWDPRRALPLLPPPPHATRRQVASGARGRSRAAAASTSRSPRPCFKRPVASSRPLKGWGGGGGGHPTRPPAAGSDRARPCPWRCFYPSRRRRRADPLTAPVPAAGSRLRSGGAVRPGCCDRRGGESRRRWAHRRLEKRRQSPPIQAAVPASSSSAAQRLDMPIWQFCVGKPLRAFLKALPEHGHLCSRIMQLSTHQRVSYMHDLSTPR
ncbi:uncharacterized protein LOC133213041 [Neopsephotus bourkii]|uniref:uncharacterized protein LOC133213041 n=1 Tax=Neopsephotus bourkii TaxID=309878 RepID=UPI002AA5BBD2|nr:uncharacterized protein LOC133213041 [Neopsephotus bourkii]